MNNANRKAIRQIYSALEELQDSIETINGDLVLASSANDEARVEHLTTAINAVKQQACDDHAADLQQLGDDEQEKFDNLTEGLQQSEKGQEMEEAASTLQEAAGCLEEDPADIEGALEALGNLSL